MPIGRGHGPVSGQFQPVVLRRGAQHLSAVRVRRMRGKYEPIQDLRHLHQFLFSGHRCGSLLSSNWFLSFSLEHFRVLVKASCPLRCLVSSSSDPPANSATFPLIFRLFIPLQVRETTKLMSDLWKSLPEQVSTFRKIPILALPHCPSAVAFSVLTALKGKTFTFFIGFRSNFHLIAHEIFYISSFGSKSIRVTVWLKRRLAFSAICWEITKNLNFSSDFNQIFSNFHKMIAHKILYILSFGSRSIRVTFWMKTTICVQRHLLRNY